ncbi:MAG TPA: C-GCAxxG-C-C family protein [Syntrophomonas sp.]|nr:C-GCAxxG-C-C family protein [Syntrophomonas sp.]
MSKIDDALRYFADSGSCSQAIVLSFGPELGLPPEIAIKTAAAFGGGIARSGELCGALSGALMVIGLTRVATPGKEHNEVIYELGQEFLQRFHNRIGSTVCRDLLGADLSTAEGRQKARREDLFVLRCTNYVKAAAEILEEMLPVIR